MRCHSRSSLAFSPRSCRSHPGRLSMQPTQSQLPATRRLAARTLVAVACRGTAVPRRATPGGACGGLLLNCCEVTPETCGDIESGVDFVVQSDWGYSVNQVASPDICWTKCQEVPMCQAWTWIKDAGLGGLFPGQCWLKGGLPTIKEKKDGFVSGTLPRAKAYFSAPPAAESVQEGAGNACLEIVNDIEYVVESPQEQRNFWSVFKDHVETADDCCSMCNAEPTCGSWTFVRDAHLPSGPPGQCWLKGGKPTGSTQKSGIISGLRAGVRSMAMK
mmetsp:Transcript_115012/g.371917  ORF Transcript_115012/g.371917 Transcript_115012/m.371917 type:complete len:274 (-) Transcript_115012:76-897(-)